MSLIANGFCSYVDLWEKMSLSDVLKCNTAIEIQDKINKVLSENDN